MNVLFRYSPNLYKWCERSLTIQEHCDQGVRPPALHEHVRFKGIGLHQYLYPNLPPPSSSVLDAPITCVTRLPLDEWVDLNVEERKSCMFGKFQRSQQALPVRKRVLFKYQTVIVGKCSHVQNAMRSQDLFWSKEIMGCLHWVDKDKF